MVSYSGGLVAHMMLCYLSTRLPVLRGLGLLCNALLCDMHARHPVLQVMSQQGVSLVRVFCFQDGYDLSNTPIQSSPGNWNEDGLKRIDLILSQAAQYGIYVIVVGTTFEPVGLQFLSRWVTCFIIPTILSGLLLKHQHIAGAHKFRACWRRHAVVCG